MYLAGKPLLPEEATKIPPASVISLTNFWNS